MGAAYAAWAADRERGIDSVMMAGTHDQVSVFNAHARTDRLARDGGLQGRAVAVRHGLAVPAGDTIVTKANDRRLTLGQSDFVRNGYRYTLRDVADDGSPTAVQIGTNRVVTLPAPRLPHTVAFKIASLAPIVRRWSENAITSLAEITGSAVRDSLPPSGPQRLLAEQALRSVLTVLEGRKPGCLREILWSSPKRELVSLKGRGHLRRFGRQETVRAESGRGQADASSSRPVRVAD